MKVQGEELTVKGTHNDVIPPHNQEKLQRTPLPWFQFSIVLFLQLAEPLTSQVIYPFAPQLIRDIGITKGDEAKVGYYVGLMQSLFFFTEALTVLHWSRLSDRVGRKPVILSGLCGLSISMYCFGLSKTFWGLVLSRCLSGGLNGNIGVIKSMMAEMTDSTNISQAYAYMPIAWSTGGTLGPIIGGSLAYPTERFPYHFGNSRFLREHPYFLSCAVPATFSLVAWVVTFLFLKETASFTTQTYFRPSFASRSKATFGDEVSSKEPSFEPKPTPGHLIDDSDKPLSLRSVLSRRVVIASANYAVLALVDIAFRAIQPLFLSTPVELGGLGLPPSVIGNILSVFGVLNGVVQVFFFARIHDRFGSKQVFTTGILSALPAFALFPTINFFAREQGTSPFVCFLVWLQIVVSVGISLAYGAILIFISESSPNRRSLGAVNGLAQMAVSFMRAIGPAAADSLFSISIDGGYLGGWLVYYVLISAVVLATFVAGMLPRRIPAVSHQN